MRRYADTWGLATTAVVMDGLARSASSHTTAVCQRSKLNNIRLQTAPKGTDRDAFEDKKLKMKSSVLCHSNK